MTYGELPEPRQDVKLKGGGYLIVRQPVLLCRGCGEHSSANPSDYWNTPKDWDITCAQCDTPMVLVEQRESFIPYGMDAEYDAFMGELWAKVNHEG